MFGDVESFFPYPPTNMTALDGDEKSDRFYSEGIDAHQKEILDYVDSKDEQNSLVMNGDESQMVSQLLDSVLQAMETNAMLRSEFADEPMKFLDSENQLHEAVIRLSVIAANGLQEALLDDQFRDPLMEIFSLSAHSNETIAEDLFRIVFEWIEDNEDSEEWARRSLYFVKDLHLSDNLAVFLKNTEQQVFSNDTETALVACLGLIESLSSNDEVCAEIYSNADLREYVFKQAVNITETSDVEKEPSLASLCCDQAVLFLFALFRRNQLDSMDLMVSFVEPILVTLAKFLPKMPSESSPAFEYVAALFNCLRLMVVTFRGQEEFLLHEGPELMLLFISKYSSVQYFLELPLQVLSEALLNDELAARVAAGIIESGGLKTLFKIYRNEVKRSGVFGNASSKLAKHKKLFTTVSRYLVSIINSMIKWTEPWTDVRIRLTGKLISNDGEYLDFLIKQRSALQLRLAEIRSQFGDDNELTEEDELELQLALSEANQQSYYRISEILGWLLIDEPQNANKLVGRLVETIKSDLVKYRDDLEAELSEVKQDTAAPEFLRLSSNLKYVNLLHEMLLDQNLGDRS